MFPKMGKTFPNEDRMRVGRIQYQSAIAVALRRELGGTHRAIKTLMSWTGVSERTAKNWLSGSHGPSGEHLVMLMCNSDEILTTILELSGREKNKHTIQTCDLRAALLAMVSILDETMQP